MFAGELDFDASSGRRGKRDDADDEE